MKHFTDSLLDESYNDLAGLYDDQEKATALAEFTEHAKEGWLDLDNFHVAYDDDLKADNLFDNFSDDGKLKGRWTYGACKDGNTPGKKAMKQLWTYLYSTGGTIVKNGRTIDVGSKVLKSKEEFDKDQHIKKFYEFTQVLRTNYEKILNNKFSALIGEHKNLVKKIFDWADQAEIDRKCAIEVRVLEENKDKDDYRVDAWTCRADKFADDFKDAKLSDFIYANIETDDIKDVLKKLYDNVKDNLNKVIQSEKEAYDEVKILLDLCHKYNYLLDYNERFYMRIKSTGQLARIDLEKEPKIVEVDTNMPITVSDVNDIEPVAIKKHHDWTGRCYVDSHTYNSWNSKALSKKESDALGLFTNEEEGSANAAQMFGSGYWLTDGSGSDYYKLPGFDTWSHERYECDSGD